MLFIFISLAYINKSAINFSFAVLVFSSYFMLHYFGLFINAGKICTSFTPDYQVFTVTFSDSYI
jgi:uncharacterized membrane protein